MRELTIEGCAQYNAQLFLQKILHFFENPTGGNNFDAAARYRTIGKAPTLGGNRSS